jgi:BASS family bile acid:Na+ symporter
MSETFETLANLSILVFVVCSMLSMGFSLTMQQIIEPLRNAS